jgi:hypothetical protein
MDSNSYFSMDDGAPFSIFPDPGAPSGRVPGATAPSEPIGVTPLGCNELPIRLIREGSIDPCLGVNLKNAQIVLKLIGPTLFHCFP